MTLGEIGRTVQKIDAKLTTLEKEWRSEMRDIGHRANNALQLGQLQKVQNEVFKEKIEHIDASDGRQWERIDHLSQNAASQAAVDSYRKWIIGVFVGLGGLSIVNLIFNLSQMGGR